MHRNGVGQSRRPGSKRRVGSFFYTMGSIAPTDTRFKLRVVGRTLHFVKTKNKNRNNSNNRLRFLRNLRLSLPVPSHRLPPTSGWLSTESLNQMGCCGELRRYLPSEVFLG